MKKQAFFKTRIFLTTLTLFVLLSSFYLQYQVGLQPCPLCLMQRFSIIILLGLLFTSFSAPKYIKTCSALLFLFAAAGFYFASRQLWLQTLPTNEVPACLPGLNVLIHYFPWQTVVKSLFLGSSDCTEVPWSLLGLSLPAWCALYFLFMLLTSFLGIFTRKKSVNSL